MVGLNVQEPETTCDDPNCPFHVVTTNSLENMKDMKKGNPKLTFTNLIV